MNQKQGMAIELIYQQLRGLLGEYAETGGFNRAPAGAPEEDGLAYTTRRLAEIRQSAQVLLEPFPELADRMARILEETEAFLRQYEQPGVVWRWRELDPALVYFDCAFELLGECPEEFERMQMGLSPFRLSCYPDGRWVERRREYFAQARARFAREGREYDEDLVFQEELCRALELVFQADFGAERHGAEAGE